MTTRNKEELSLSKQPNHNMACLDKAIDMTDKLGITDIKVYKRTVLDLVKECEICSAYKFLSYEDDVGDELTGQTIY
jgi:hypothetical protein